MGFPRGASRKQRKGMIPSKTSPCSGTRHTGSRIRSESGKLVPRETVIRAKSLKAAAKRRERRRAEGKQ